MCLDWHICSGDLCCAIWTIDKVWMWLNRSSDAKLDKHLYKWCVSVANVFFLQFQIDNTLIMCYAAIFLRSIFQILICRLSSAKHSVIPIMCTVINVLIFRYLRQDMCVDICVCTTLLNITNSKQWAPQLRTTTLGKLSISHRNARRLISVCVCMCVCALRIKLCAYCCRSGTIVIRAYDEDYISGIGRRRCDV